MADCDEKIMPTTINLDDEESRLTGRAIAEASSKTLSDLAPASQPINSTRGGFPVLSRRLGALPVTTEHVNDLQDALDREETA